MNTIWSWENPQWNVDWENYQNTHTFSVIQETVGNVWRLIEYENYWQIKIMKDSDENYYLIHDDWRVFLKWKFRIDEPVSIWDNDIFIVPYFDYFWWPTERLKLSKKDLWIRY